MASDTPCGGDAFELFLCIEAYLPPKKEGCLWCAKSATNGGKCGGGAPEAEA